MSLWIYTTWHYIYPVTLLCLWSHLCEVYQLFLQNLALIYWTECEAGPNLNTEGQYKKPVFMTAWPCCLSTHRYTYLMRRLFNSVRRILPSLHMGNKSSCADEAHELFSSQQWWQYRLQRFYAVRHAGIEEWYINMHWSVSVCLAFSGFCICVFQSINLPVGSQTSPTLFSNSVLKFWQSILANSTTQIQPGTCTYINHTTVYIHLHCTAGLNTYNTTNQARMQQRWC